ncbi:MAG TPA: hypothetical protein VK794_08050 [Steroidobacteraceae bacterium]|jgi:hypothetical protein|nr:hypothetical protein [Steroidobacteraceae bacterium]
MKFAFALFLLLPALVRAGVAYDERTTSIRQPQAVVRHYYVQNGQWRGDDANGIIIALLRNQTAYVIDNAHRTFEVLPKTKVDQAAARLAALTPSKIANMPPEERERMEKILVRMQVPAPVYVMTDRSELVEGHACRIWEGIESGTKRLELCVAASGTVSGGGEILAALKELSHFFPGRTDAQGMQVGAANWWKGVENFDGLPISIRSFNDGTAVSETIMTAVHEEVLSPALFDVPVGYQLQEPKHAVHMPEP